MRNPISLIAFLLVVLVMLGGCGASDNEPYADDSCDMGGLRQCACINGTGLQECLPFGYYGDCICGGDASLDLVGDRDAGTNEDASTDSPSDGMDVLSDTGLDLTNVDIFGDLTQADADATRDEVDVVGDVPTPDSEGDVDDDMTCDPTLVCLDDPPGPTCENGIVTTYEWTCGGDAGCVALAAEETTCAFGCSPRSSEPLCARLAYSTGDQVDDQLCVITSRDSTPTCFPAPAGRGMAWHPLLPDLIAATHGTAHSPAGITIFDLAAPSSRSCDFLDYDVVGHSVWANGTWQLPITGSGSDNGRLVIFTETMVDSPPEEGFRLFELPYLGADAGDPCFDLTPGLACDYRWGTTSPESDLSVATRSSDGSYFCTIRIGDGTGLGVLDVQRFTGDSCGTESVLAEPIPTVGTAGWASSRELLFTRDGSLRTLRFMTAEGNWVEDVLIETINWNAADLEIVDFNYDGSVVIARADADSAPLVFIRVPDAAAEDPGYEPWPDEANHVLTGPMVNPSIERFEPARLETALVRD